jgi:hypothetical protein
MSVETNQVLSAFLAAMKDRGAAPPLLQKDVKPVVVLMADRLSGLGTRTRGPRPRMFANRAHGLGQALRFTKLESHESMLDVAVYRGATDPFAVVLTAESEAFARHGVGPTLDSEGSDCLWDLFKLLQVPSPIRLFVARVVSKRVAELEKMVERTVRAYSPLLAPADLVFSLVLPTAKSSFVGVRCCGWRKTRAGALIRLPDAGRPPASSTT